MEYICSNRQAIRKLPGSGLAVTVQQKGNDQTVRSKSKNSKMAVKKQLAAT